MANDAFDNAEADKSILRQVGAKAEREQHVEDAARILSTYFIDATRGVRLDVNDLRAELLTAMWHIVDAATPVVTVKVDSVPPEKLKPGEPDARD